MSSVCPQVSSDGSILHASVTTFLNMASNKKKHTHNITTLMSKDTAVCQERHVHLRKMSKPLIIFFHNKKSK